MHSLPYIKIVLKPVLYGNENYYNWKYLFRKKTLKNKVLYSNMVIIFKLSFKWYISSIHAPVLCSFIIIIIEKKISSKCVKFRPKSTHFKNKVSYECTSTFFLIMETMYFDTLFKLITWKIWSLAHIISWSL